jgi:phosphate-selective porin OprO/OprP
MTRTAKSLLLAATSALAMMGAAGGALAQPVATASALPSGISQEQALALSARLDALERRNGELEAELTKLKGQVAQASKPDPSAAKATLANARPALASGDGRFTAQFRGVAQLDGAHYDQDAAGPLASDFRRGSLGDATEADRARDLSDGFNIRRARLGVEGKAWGDWNYALQFDFGGTGTEEAGRINNLYLEYAGLKSVRIRAGAFPPTTSLEDATSNTAMLFLERPAVAELVRGLAGGDGRTALAVLANGERWNAFAAVTGNLVTQQTFDEQLGFVGRLSYVPFKGGSWLIHVGGNANLIVNPAATGPDVPPGVATAVRLRERPELRVDGTRLVDTGSIDADGVRSLGLELAGQWKNVSLAGEHFWIDVDRRASPLADPDFGGWYLQGAWTITGQPRRYSTAAGGFDAPRVEKPFNFAARTWGIWELAARYSDLDLDYDAGGPFAPPSASAIRGGVQRISSLGLNWYPNNNVRFLADVQHVDVDRLSPGGTAFGTGALTPPAGAQVGQEYNVWSLRTQYAF